MNYYEFLRFFNLYETSATWILFEAFRKVADVKGENEAVRQFHYLMGNKQ